MSRLRAAAIACCVLGLGVAGYLTYVHFAGVAPVCEVVHGCERVQTSRWSDLAGIPVAVLGLLTYAGILVALLVAGETALMASAGLSLVGFGFSLYLTYREVFTMKAICVWCVISALLMTALAVLTVARMLRAPGAPAATTATRYGPTARPTNGWPGPSPSPGPRSRQRRMSTSVPRIASSARMTRALAA